MHTVVRRQEDLSTHIVKLDTFALDGNDKQARVFLIVCGCGISLLGRAAHGLLLLVVMSCGGEARQEKGIVDRDRHGGNV